MTKREAHEKAAGMGLDDMFFRFNGIDPGAEAEEATPDLSENNKTEIKKGLERAEKETWEQSIGG
jgi:hypothetical protein